MRRRNQGMQIGAGWVSLMEPEPGAELAFHRWYADDHFYAGGMNLAGIFAGRRWVATRELQALRYPADSPLIAPVTGGRFLHTNLFAEGATDDVAEGLGVVISGLASVGRMYITEIPRKHVFSRIQPFAGVVYRDDRDDRPLDIHALDYPFSGLVLEIVEASGDRGELVDWLTGEFIPSAIGRTSAEMCLVFLDADLPEAITKKSGRIPQNYGGEPQRRVILMWLLNEPPGGDWQQFAAHGEQFSRSGRATVQFAAPFIPTVPGSDAHIDEL